MKKILIATSVLVISAGIGLFWVYTGFVDVRATTPHSGLTKSVLSAAMHASVKRNAKGIEVPSLETEELILEGINDFEAMCVDCHGAPGKKPGPVGQGLNPPAPDLQMSAEHHSPAELFWITKYGIKMTGMPAWGASHDDKSLWPVVAFLTVLPEMDASGYEALRKSAKGMGHHADSDGKENHAHDSVQKEPAGKHSEHTHEHHDHEH